MRSFLPFVAALACPVFMCAVPMLMMRRKGADASCGTLASSDPKEVQRLRTEVSALRAELDERNVRPAVSAADAKTSEHLL